MTDSSATLGWSPSTPVSGTIVGYRVFRNEIPVGQMSAPEISLTELAPSTSYRITVVAVDSLGAISAPSAPLAVGTSEPPPTHGNVQAFLLASTDQSFFDLEAHYQQIGVVYPTYYNCGRGGIVSGSEWPLVTGWARARQIEVMPRLNCHNPADEEQILSEPAAGEHMIEQLTSLCESNGYSGVQIDFEDASPAEREPFTAWITALAARLHAIGDKLSTVVTAKYYNVTTRARRDVQRRCACRSPPTTSSCSTGASTGPPPRPVGWPNGLVHEGRRLHRDDAQQGQVRPRDADVRGRLAQRRRLRQPRHAAGVRRRDGGAASSGRCPNGNRGGRTALLLHRLQGVHHEVWYTDQQSLAARAQLAESLGLSIGLWHLGPRTSASGNCPSWAVEG